MPSLCSLLVGRKCSSIATSWSRELRDKGDSTNHQDQGRFLFLCQCDYRPWIRVFDLDSDTQRTSKVAGLAGPLVHLYRAFLCHSHLLTQLWGRWPTSLEGWLNIGASQRRRWYLVYRQKLHQSLFDQNYWLLSSRSSRQYIHTPSIEQRGPYPDCYWSRTLWWRLSHLKQRWSWSHRPGLDCRADSGLQPRRRGVHVHHVSLPQSWRPRRRLAHDADHRRRHQSLKNHKQLAKIHAYRVVSEYTNTVHQVRLARKGWANQLHCVINPEPLVYAT